MYWKIKFKAFGGMQRASFKEFPCGVFPSMGQKAKNIFLCNKETMEVSETPLNLAICNPSPPRFKTYAFGAYRAGRGGDQIRL